MYNLIINCVFFGINVRLYTNKAFVALLINGYIDSAIAGKSKRTKNFR